MADEAESTGRSWFDGAAFRQDLRAAWLDASAALLITLLLFAWLHQRVDGGTSATLDVMPFLEGGADTYWMYWLCQAFGWSGLLWAWITVILGLTRSSRSPAWLPVSPARLEKWHRTTSLTTVALMFLHAFWFFAEEVRYNADGLGVAGRTWTAFVNVFVPGAYGSGTGLIAILLGLLALYLAIPLGLAYYARRSIGPRAWRTLHASIIVVYVLSVWHTLLYGTNVWYDGWFRTTVWLLQLPVAGLLLVRLLVPAHRPHRGRLDLAGRWAARVAVVVTVWALLTVAATGHDGGRTRGVEGAPLNVTQTTIWAGLTVFAAVVTVAVVRAHRAARAARAGRRDRDEQRRQTAAASS
ncbi:ferric reductase-like transmembrane domain-containing protein [Jiangella rhizosphaerae]|uniref:Iron reductase n=1 Tax=Jiangella rhizosphaerae TaxID=2293569 RepID=A0A418KTQ6_9ACTN|nr:ferric reductase-like transmembrane domain-containing protein [Jiangella rhizosphaerae]RIQ30257.1 iron reductase [Jiangella rhizosphaerae]